jgi:putative methanogenesis marker protein 8
MKNPPDRHIMRQAAGEVLIENGKIISATKPLVKWCPLHKILYGKDIIHTPDFCKEHVRLKMRKVGMFTKDRIVESENDLVPYGASEMLMCAKKYDIIDCAVLACDCAGTVIATTPQLIQGIGEWMGGLIETSPIPEVIERMENAGGIVLDPANASIDQVAGAKKAFDLGYKRIAVTIAGKYADSLPEFRQMEQESGGELLILTVCNTGVSISDAKLMTQHADLVWACASKAVWDVVGPAAMLQIGVGIPVFALTEWAKKIVEKRAATIDRRVSIFTENLPYVGAGKHPRPLV